MTILIIACGVLAAGFFAGLVWLLLLKADLRQMRNKLTAITKTDTNAQLTTKTFDKNAAALTQAINEMLRQNRQNFVELQCTETTLKRAITNISHDLRTPLTAARGYLQMLASADEETKARYIETIRSRMENLSVQMDGLFEFAKIIEGSAPINIQPVNVANILRDVLSEAYIELERKHFTVKTNIPSQPSIHQADPEALRRVLQNLIKNAYVHGHELLEISLTAGKIKITNKTEGPINTKHLFDRFYTADASRSNKNTGLGLAIAKELIGRMNGQITARAEGGMVTVEVELR
ncbi:MAG: HAMP domain-containing histidine kinase [Defluviitaleaceae bacterium]|nr:HAMP domain-containing histidine kinase [Defluviitaleaceae bacterium]